MSLQERPWRKVQGLHLLTEKKIKSASKGLIALHNVFHKQSSHNESAVYTGYIVVETTAKGERACQDSEPLKHLLVIAEAEFLHPLLCTHNAWK